MGYRVGGQCFATSEEASDYKMSLVTPTITQDGTLRLPIRKEDGWYYPVIGINHQTMFVKVELTHPRCEQNAAFNEGVQVGLILTALFAVVFFVKLIVKLLYESFYVTKGDD